MTIKTNILLQFHHIFIQILSKEKRVLVNAGVFLFFSISPLVILISWQFKYSVFKKGRFFSK